MYMTRCLTCLHLQQSTLAGTYRYAAGEEVLLCYGEHTNIALLGASHAK